MFTTAKGEFKDRFNGARLKKKQAAATLRSRTAGSQDESRCSAIHKFNGSDTLKAPAFPQKADPSLRPAPVPQSRDGKEKARDCVRDDTWVLCFSCYGVSPAAAGAAAAERAASSSTKTTSAAAETSTTESASTPAAAAHGAGDQRANPPAAATASTASGAAARHDRVQNENDNSQDEESQQATGIALTRVAGPGGGWGRAAERDAAILRDHIGDAAG